MRFDILSVLRRAFWPIDDVANHHLQAAIKDDERASATLGFESRRAGVLAASGEDIRASNLDQAVEALVQGKGR